MVTGRMYIDGVDAWKRYGVCVEQGGYKSVVQMPALKTISVTDWGEYDGEEADLTAPVLDSRKVSLPLCISNIRKAEDLYATMADGAYHEFRFVDIGKTYTMRMTDTSSFTQLVRLGKLTLALNEDNPQAPTAGTISKTYVTGYEIDDIDIGSYGIHVVEGTEESLRKAAAIRPALSISAADMTGIWYDADGTVHFKAKDATLKLFIHADSISDFWARYESLFAMLIKADARRLYFPRLETEYECYYKSCSVSEFDVLRGGRIWCAFGVTMRITNPAISTTWEGLVSEADYWILTENGVKVIV
jgi:hypothetical protein